MQTCWDQPGIIAEPYYGEIQETWLTAVMNDDVEMVQQQLHQACDDERYLLLEGWISSDSFWSNWKCKAAEMQYIMTVQRPLSLAAVCGAYRVIHVLYSSGIDVFQTDKLGNTVIHTLIIHTSRQEAKESKYLEMFDYLARLLPRAVFSKLLLVENTSSLRAVEMAAHLQTFCLMDAIFKSPGPYRIELAKCGTISIDQYDVTEYECDFQCRPWAYSPMFLLVLLKSAKLKSVFTTEFFTTGIIGKWLEIRKKIYLPFVILWAAVRLLVILTAFFPAGLTDSAAAETKVCGLTIPMSPSVKLASGISLITVTTLWLLYDIYDIIRYYRLYKPWTETYAQLQGQQVVRYKFYRINQFLLNFIILIACVNRMSWHMWGYSLPLYPAQMLFVIIVTSSVWSMLYFAQLIPIIGTYVIATQRMLYNLTKFFIIMMIFITPFAIMFPKFIFRNDDGTCPDEFSSAVSPWYTSFTTILNMNNFRSFNAPSKESLWLIHVMYTTIIAVLLLNFLIAIFADSYSEVANNPEVITNIQWMAIIATIDFRMPRCLYPLVRWMKQRYFSYTNGRLYVKDFMPG